MAHHSSVIFVVQRSRLAGRREVKSGALPSANNHQQTYAIQKELQKTTPDPGAGEPDLRRIWLDTQRKLVALASKAKNARQQMESLKKAIESHDQKK